MRPKFRSPHIEPCPSLLAHAVVHRLEPHTDDEQQARRAVDEAARLLDDSLSAVRTAKTAIAAFEQSRLLLTPLPLLPLEVLAEIIDLVNTSNDFQYTRNANGRTLPPAFVAASVCRRWRAAALSRCSIWSYIFVDFCDLDRIDQYLDLMLERSGVQPLNVSFRNIPPDMDEADPIDEQLLITAFSRCAQLQLRFCRGDDQPGPEHAEMTFEHSILPFLQVSMPMLEFVDFYCDECRLVNIAGGTQILTLAPKLKHLRVLGEGLYPIIVPSTLPEIITLTSAGTLTLKDVRVAAAAWPKLQTLAVTVIDSATQPGDGPIEMPNLHRLDYVSPSDVEIAPFLEASRIPKLEHLSVIWSLAGLTSLAQAMSTHIEWRRIITLQLSFIPVLGSDSQGDAQCLAVLGHCTKLTSLLLLQFDAHTLRLVFQALSSTPASVAKLDNMVMEECAFNPEATQAVLNFLVIHRERTTASGPRHRLRSLRISYHLKDESKGPSNTQRFPSWLQPQLERLVPNVDVGDIPRKY
ncbi:hypothetical protein EXIGLDRAFT_830130 [Exidia glandulosa HHB12029]|uniref:F-box domain-containing protein n=1 Tax=Exidia glandulosa HHB12029 TaxID=1314781 RepID=A0A166BIM7_EXIGL|nr:hypothetical protein EXIGLDRAFT_830130 [Exidia glandulosa HHB12029]